MMMMMNNIHSTVLSVVLISLALIATGVSADGHVGHAEAEMPAVVSRSVDVSPVDYMDTSNKDNDEFPLLGYVSIPQSAIDDESMQLPAVVIVPDWNNVNEYEMIRATMINEEMGWIGFVADIYGPDLHDVQEMEIKMEQATLYRSDSTLFRGRIQSAIDVLKAHPNVDSDKIAIMGYCLGGTGVLGYSFANTEDSDIVGAVSFHGGLMDFNVTGEMESPLLVLSGGNDDAGTAVEDLEARLEEAEATWQITRYSGVEHGFTDFMGPAYNEWVDHRSWDEMATFLKERFGELEYGTIEPTEELDYMVVEEEDEVIDDDDDDTDVVAENRNHHLSNDTDVHLVMVETIAYDDNGFALEGYLATPSSSSNPSPAVVIVPDWDGVNGPTGYEAERAVMMAQEGGYVAMVADIYGTEYTDVEDMETRIELSTKYRNDPELFVGRIKAAVDLLVAHPAVDSTQIFVAGYCLGGTGAMDYAFSEGIFENVKAVVPIHGGLNPLREIKTEEVKPYVLILSGGIDDSHGNPTELEQALDGANTTWEISRYSNAAHGFTAWDTPAYQEMADSRSWMSMMSLFKTLTTDDHDTMTTEEKSDDTTMVDEEPPMSEDMDDSSEDSDDEDDDSAAAGISFVVSVVAVTILSAIMC